MSSADLIDPKIWAQLCKQIERQKWATTYLFTGKELERKKTLALAFAKALNCSKDAYQASCDCSVCKRIESGVYPDVRWYGLDEDAATIKISEARDFQNWLNLKPFEGKVKVFIFNQAERLTAEAQNALLKSLEEPPPGNIIVILVPHRKMLFDTISSRAMEIKVTPFETAQVRDLLIREGVSRTEAEFLARLSQGELSRAREAHEKKWFREKNAWLDELTRDPVSFLDWFSSETRDEISRVFDFLVEWLRDLLIFSMTADSEHLIHVDRLSLIQSVARDKDFESMLELFEGIERIRKSIGEYANQKLALTEAEILLERFFKR